jgi:hypothetical protein
LGCEKIEWPENWEVLAQYLLAFAGAYGELLDFGLISNESGDSQLLVYTQSCLNFQDLVEAEKD